MTITSKREVARVLRIEAQNVKRHGFSDVPTYSFDCLQAQVLRPDPCLGCLLKDFIPEQSRGEAFPCQHIDPDGYHKIFAEPGMPEKISTRLSNLVEELEAAAEKEEA
jgi:hypothetical protein